MASPPYHDTWSAELYTIKDIAAKFTPEVFPYLLHVEEGYYAEDDETSLSNGDMLFVHGILSFMQAQPLDQGTTKEVYLPLHIPDKLEVRRASHYQPNHIFQSVRDLVKTDFPRFASAIKSPGIHHRLVPTPFSFPKKDKTIELLR